MIKDNILERRKKLAEITVRQTEIKGNTSTKQHREKKDQCERLEEDDFEK